MYELHTQNIYFNNTKLFYFNFNIGEKLVKLIIIQLRLSSNFNKNSLKEVG